MSPPPTWSWLARLCQERAAPSPHPRGLGNGRTSVACSVFHIKLYYSATVPVHHIYSLKLPSLTERADLKLGPSTLPCRGASSLPRSVAARLLHCDVQGSPQLPAPHPCSVQSVQCPATSVWRAREHGLHPKLTEGPRCLIHRAPKSGFGHSHSALSPPG